MKLKYILSVVSMFSLSLLVVTQNKDFCQSYADNDFKVDYGYPSEIEMFTEHEIFLFIGHDYWLIDTDKAEMIYFMQNKSKSINWFGSQYRAAIIVEFCCIDREIIGPNQLNYSVHMTGLLYKRNNTIDWAAIRSTSFHWGQNQQPPDLPLQTLFKWEDYRHYLINKTQIYFEPGFVPSLAFNFKKFSTETPYCFLQQNKINATLFERTFRCYNFDRNTGVATNATDQVIQMIKEERGFKHNGSDYSLLNKVRDTHEVIAIFDKKRSLFMILEKEGKAITLCLTLNKLLHKGCYFAYPLLDRVLLINCSDYKKSTPTTTKLTTISSKSSSLQTKATSLPVTTSTSLPSKTTVQSSTQTTKPLPTFVSTEQSIPSITSKTESTTNQNISVDSLPENENQQNISLKTKARSLTLTLVLMTLLLLY